MNKSFRIMAIALTAIALVGLTSCEMFLTLMASPTVKVLDARTGSAIPGVTVTLTPIVVEKDYTPTTVTSTSGNDGSVVFSSTVAYGTYKVTGVKTGYVFIPFEATIAGWSTDLGKMFGVTAGKGGDLNAVSIFLTWGNTTKDIDAYFTYPNSFEAPNGAPKGTTFDQATAYYDVSFETRTNVYWNAKKLSTNFASLDVDDTDGEGPETISLVGENTGTASGGMLAVTSSTPFIGSALAAGNYYWMGAGVYYLNAYTPSSSLDTQSVRVVVTQGSDIKGIFTLPTNMPQKTISLFRVHLFYSADQTKYYMVFMPDHRLYDGTSNIKSLNTDSTFVISGSK